jgi:histone deacetylase complex regulatory component SIN3
MSTMDGGLYKKPRGSKVPRGLTLHINRKYIKMKRQEVGASCSYSHFLVSFHLFMLIYKRVLWIKTMSNNFLVLMDIAFVIIYDNEGIIKYVRVCF